jgi:hypothetical protein
MDAATNLQNMKKLDDSWNEQDLQTFRKYHTKDCIVRWPNQPPTHGVDAHEQEAIAFFKMFPDQHLINNPYKIMLAQGEWTCTVADFTGTMKGAMTMPDGTVSSSRTKVSTLISVQSRAGTNTARSWKRTFFTISWAC